MTAEIATIALEGGGAALARELAAVAEGAGCAILPASSRERVALLLVAGDGQASALDRVRSATQAAPARPVAVIADGGYPTPLEAMGAGARWVMERPLAVPDLVAALAALSSEDAGRQHGARESIVVLLGAAGGCGTTTCAAAISAGLEGVLIDLDLALGDAAEVAGAPGARRETLVELACAPASGGAPRLAGTPGGKSQVLAAPGFPEHADLVDEHGSARILDALEGENRVLVVDAGARIGVETIPALERAGAILIVTPNGTRGTRGASRQASLLVRLGLGAIPIGLVVTGTRDQSSAGEVALAAGVPLWAVVPEDRAVRRAAERGIPAPPGAYTAVLACVREALA